jgi:hypothetical protein
VVAGCAQNGFSARRKRVHEKIAHSESSARRLSRPGVPQTFPKGIVCVDAQIIDNLVGRELEARKTETLARDLYKRSLWSNLKTIRQ